MSDSPEMSRRGLSKLLLGSAAGAAGLAMVARAQPARATDPGPGAHLPQTAHEIAVQVMPEDFTYPEGHLFRYLTATEVLYFKARNGNIYLTGSLKKWLMASQGRTGFLPQGEAWFDETLEFSGGTIVGTGVGSILVAINCDGIHIPGDSTTLHNFQIRSHNDYMAGRGGVVCVDGTEANPRSKIYLSSLNVRGFGIGIDWRYTWNSRLDDVDTLYCHKAVRLFGRSVNNMITGSRLLAAADHAGPDLNNPANVYPIIGTDSVCISIEADYSFVNAPSGEGLGISSTLLAFASCGIACTEGAGFLALGIDDSCIIDLMSGRAFDLNYVKAFKCSAQWVFSRDTCFYFRDIWAGSVPVNAHIDVGEMTCYGPFGSGVHWGANNIGLQLRGNVTTSNVNGGYPVVIVGTGVAVTAHIKSGNPAVEGVLVSSTGNTVTPIGNRSIDWQVSPVAQVPAAVRIALPRNGCNTFYLTGMGTVTWIDADSWNGQEVTIIAEHRLTLRSGGNLVLAGDFAASSGHTIKLTCYGTTLENAKWYEVSRSENTGRRR